MFSVENHCTLVLVHPLTDEAEEWLKETAEDALWRGGALVIEPARQALLDGLFEEGFAVQQRRISVNEGGVIMIKPHREGSTEIPFPHKVFHWKNGDITLTAEADPMRRIDPPKIEGWECFFIGFHGYEKPCHYSYRPVR